MYGVCFWIHVHIYCQTKLLLLSKVLEYYHKIFLIQEIFLWMDFNSKVYLLLKYEFG